MVSAPRIRPFEAKVENRPAATDSDELRAIVAKLDSALQKAWAARGLRPSAPAPELAVMRRAALALLGSIPSLEEIRRFEATPAEARLERWTDSLLHDRRTADYLAERFARTFVGTEDGPFVLFRRRRLTSWLSDAFHTNRAYDAIVRDLIAEQGLWTDHPATNFVTVTFDQEKGRPDPERLAARVSRAFLGIRLDCAQCHDHPFEPWKQAEFRGLAAFFGGVRTDLRGVREESNDYAPKALGTNASGLMEPCIPFQKELLPQAGTPRSRLAAWVTNEQNVHLARVTVNRMWALLYGRPLCDPIDDLPEEADVPEVLALAAADFAEHGFDLHRLIRVLTRCQPFLLDSREPYEDAGPTPEQSAEWASFPISRLRPEQVAGALFQSASLASIGPDAFWLVRLIAFTGRNEFVRRYGDLGEDEFEDRSGTIAQRLLLLNGELVRETTKGGLFSSVSRVAQQSSDARQAVEAAYLIVLTRRPSEDELAYFEEIIASKTGESRSEAISDLFWTLVNSTEFSWNH
jgi:hypothetical protein